MEVNDRGSRFRIDIRILSKDKILLKSVVDDRYESGLKSLNTANIRLVGG
jgi:hypothetical protein